MPRSGFRRGYQRNRYGSGSNGSIISGGTIALIVLIYILYKILKTTAFIIGPLIAAGFIGYVIYRLVNGSKEKKEAKQWFDQYSDLATEVKPQTEQESDEKKILRIAKRKQGRITVVDIATETNISLEQAEKTMKQLATKGYVSMEVDENGRIFYEFPELLPVTEQNRLL